MKLLLATPILPHPPRTGSTLMAHHWIKHLAQRHSIDLFSFARERAPELGDLTRWCQRIETVCLPRWKSRLGKSLGSLSNLPPLVSYYQSVEMLNKVRRALEGNVYDVALFQLTHMLQFRPAGYAGVTFACLEDLQTLHLQRSLPSCPWYGRAWQRINMTRMKRYEMSHAKQFDRVLLTAEADAAEHRSLLGHAKLDWIPHGVDTEAFCPSENVLREKGMIVITGNMFHPPNVDGVDFFCRDIFPRICQHVPDASLWLVGDRPAKSVRKWGQNPKIRITGFVPDICPYLRRAMVSVCPVRLKIGTQTKVLEAMACGTPVVTTSAGNHGVAATSGEHLQVVDDPALFADRVVDLLNAAKWEMFSRQGRQYVVRNFSWEKSAAKLEKLMEQVLADKIKQ